MSERTKANKGIKVIKKSNQLIEARYRFDVWETRMFLSVLSCIRKEDTDFQTYRIWYRDVIKIFDLKSHQSYGLLREAVKSLMQKTLFVNYQDGGFTRERAYHIIRTSDYLKEGQRGDGVESQEFIDVTIEPEMMPLLLQLQKNFTAYDLRNVSKLGAQAIRFYELLKQYESIGERVLDIDYIKRILELEQEYADFSNFHHWVIKPAVKEINKYTDLTIYKYEKIKAGKRVVSLHFFFSRKTDKQIGEVRTETRRQLPSGLDSQVINTVFPEAPMPQTVIEETGVKHENKEHLIVELLPRVVTIFGVNSKVFMSLVEQNTEGDIRQAVKVTERAIKSGKIKGNTAGFFVEALRHKYTDADAEKEKKESQTKRKLEEIARLQAEQAARVEALAKEKFRREEELILSLIATDEDLVNKALSGIQQSMFAYVYDARKSLDDNLNSPSFKGAFYNAVKKIKPDLFQP